MFFNKDPLSYIGARQQKMSEIRSEKDDIESEMDMEHAAELQSLRKSLGQQTERQMQTMEDQTLEKLKAETGNKIHTELLRLFYKLAP